jgi:hypothetical protein
VNERLLELAQQAGLKKDHGSDREYLGDFDWREFAELIVKECAGLLEKEAESSHDEGTDTYNLLLNESKWIKRYFGVKNDIT